jgi:hypothetical protein
MLVSEAVSAQRVDVRLPDFCGTVIQPNCEIE